MGADFAVPLIGLAAIKAGSRGGGSGSTAWDFNNLFSLIPVKKVEGEKNDQKEEDADGPEEALHETIPVFLGVKKNPHGDDQRNDEQKDKRENHSGFSPKQLIAHS